MRPSAPPSCLLALTLLAGCADEPTPAALPARPAPVAARTPPAPPAGPTPVAARPPPPPAAAPSPAPWVELDAPTWGFRAQFPAAPHSEVMKVPTVAGELDMHMFTVDREPWAYMMTVSDGLATATPAATVLDHARDGAVANSRGRLVREQQRTHEGLPARHLEIAAGGTADPRRVFVLLVLRQQRLYQLLLVAPPTTTDAVMTAEAERFFAALHLT